MRTLFVTIMHYPPRGGTHLRNWQNINIMHRFGEVGIFSIFNQDIQIPTDIDIKTWHHYNLVKQSSILDLVERGVRLLGRFGLRYFWAYSNRAAKTLDQIIKKFNPNVVVLEELGTYPYLNVIKKHNCKIIFDNHNIESHLFEQINCSQPSMLHWLRYKFYLPQIKLAEAKLVHQATQTWVCSEEDQKLMNQLYGLTASSHVIPNAINVSTYSQVGLGNYPLSKELDNKNYKLLFLGNFFHPPNQEAAKFLIEQVCPRLKQKFGDFRLLLVGSHPLAFMKKAAQKEPNIIVTGEVPDVKPYLAAANMMVVPLYQGGGTRFKILEAFAAGCPVISTTKGAEGLNAEDGKHLLIADDVDAMIENIERILSNDNLGKRLVKSAFELVQSEYSWEAVAKRVKVAVEKLN